MTAEQLQEAGSRPELSQVMNHKGERLRKGEHKLFKTMHMRILCILYIKFRIILVKISSSSTVCI